MKVKLINMKQILSFFVVLLLLIGVSEVSAKSRKRLDLDPVGNLQNFSTSGADGEDGTHGDDDPIQRDVQRGVQQGGAPDGAGQVSSVDPNRVNGATTDQNQGANSPNSNSNGSSGGIHPNAPSGQDLYGKRKDMLAVAQNDYLGKIGDATGKRIGGDLIHELYNISYKLNPMTAGKDFFSFGPSRLDNATTPEEGANGFNKRWDHWCGVFATACAVKAGHTSGYWGLGKSGGQPCGFSSAEPIFGTDGIAPGDIGNVAKNSHWFIIVRIYDDGSLLTYDGNTDYQQVVEKKDARNLKTGDEGRKVVGYIKTFDEVWVPAGSDEAKPSRGDYINPE